MSVESSLPGDNVAEVLTFMPSRCSVKAKKNLHTRDSLFPTYGAIEKAFALKHMQYSHKISYLLPQIITDRILAVEWVALLLCIWEVPSSILV
jgi:hypothetical protein